MSLSRTLFITSTVLVYFRLTYTRWSTRLSSCFASSKYCLIFAYNSLNLLYKYLCLMNIALQLLDRKSAHGVILIADDKLVFPYKLNRAFFVLEDYAFQLLHKI